MRLNSTTVAQSYSFIEAAAAAEALNGETWCGPMIERHRALVYFR